MSHYMPPHIGGIELMAAQLFTAYTAAGADVHWIASRAPAMTPRQEAGRTRVPCWNGLERWLGVPWPLWGPTGFQKVARLAAWADVLHVHDCLYLGSAIATVAGSRHHKPIVLSQHVDLVHYRATLLNVLQRIAYRTLGVAVLNRATRIVCCTPAAATLVAALLPGSRPVVEHIPNGIDTNRFHPASPVERRQARLRLGLPASDRVVLFVGRLVEKKGSPLFLEVARRCPHIAFLMIGDGPLRPTTVPSNVRWLPQIAQEDMIDAYHSADILLLPSEGEGFPLVVIEAMAAGIPVICSKDEEFSRALETRGAVFTAARTPDALGDALARVLDDPGRVEGIAGRARDIAVQEFGRDAMTARYEALLLSLVRQHDNITRTRRTSPDTMP